MTLPFVAGWLIDFRTARAIFASGSNEKISHCVGLRNAGQMHICHYEREQFCSVDALKAAFIDSGDCVVVPDDDIMRRCHAVSMSTPGGKRPIRGDIPGLLLTAIAIAKNLGVISDHRSIKFATVFDFCCLSGVSVYSADDYFSLV